MYGVVEAYRGGRDEAVVVSRDGLGVGEAMRSGVAVLMVSAAASVRDSRYDGLCPLKFLTCRPSIEEGMVDRCLGAMRLHNARCPAPKYTILGMGERIQTCKN